MNKVILVDDDFLVCSYMRSLIIWEDYGFTVVGQAYNGQDALIMIQDTKPEIIFLDVNMPIMDGIELIRIIHERFFEVKVIMLSSYSDYDYVREAMKMGAIDYLLKHQLTQNELVSLLRTLRFDGQSAQEISTLSDSVILGNAPIAIRDSRTRSFFEKRTAEIPQSVLKTLNSILSVARVRLQNISSDVNDYQNIKNQDALVQSLISTCMQVCIQENEIKLIYMGNLNFIFIFPSIFGEQNEAHHNRVAQCMVAIQDSLWKYHNATVFWKSSDRCESYSVMPDKYLKLIRVIDDVDHNIAEKNHYIQLSLEHEKHIVQCVANTDKKALHDVFQKIFVPLIEQAFYPSHISILTGDLITLLTKLYHDNNQKSEHFDDSIHLSSIRAISYYIEDQYLNLIRIIENKYRYSTHVNDMIEYIRLNYQNNIGLNDIAKNSSLNASYISTLFKKETGMNLVTYINRIRIYVACRYMIISEKMPTQVYEHVGFNNYNNFYSIFKANTGLTPTQFRKKVDVGWLSHYDPFVLDCDSCMDWSLLR